MGEPATRSGVKLATPAGITTGSSWSRCD